MRVRSVLVVLAVLFGPASAVGADEVSVADLVAESAAYDVEVAGELTIEGEIVGDLQRRGDVVWVQVNDDPYADRALLDGGAHAGFNVGVGARMSREVFDALEVEHAGGYRVRGAIVSLTGAWHHHDERRGGESWFEVRLATVVEPERHLDEPMSWVVLLSGIALLLLSGAVMLVKRNGGPGT